MQYSLAAIALAALASATPMNGVPSASASLAPATPAAPECSASYDGTFEIQVVNVTSSSKRSLSKREALMLSLKDGILTDALGRIGYIAGNNHQFQFDYSVDGGLPQDPTIYDAGWAVCPNNTLVLGPDAVFQECLSGGFYNLYDEATAEQCNPVYIQVVSAGGSASQVPDGQVTATPVASQQPDGQVTASPVSQISDGQPQVVSQISDGQIQMPTGAPVTQISDGQIQAGSTAAPVSQISDGQPQVGSATSAALITAAPKVTGTGHVVSQISDGQIIAPTNGTGHAAPSPSVQPYTGGASRSTVFSGLAMSVLAVFAFAL